MSRIVEPIPSGDNPRWSHRGHHIGTERMPFYGGVGTNSKVVGDLILSISNVDALPSKKTRIDGPTARSEQCQGGTKSSQHDATPRISRMQKGLPQREDRHKHPRDGRP